MPSQIIHGDCLEVFREQPDDFDAFISDLPAGIAFMGRKWDALPVADRKAALAREDAFSEYWAERFEMARRCSWPITRRRNCCPEAWTGRRCAGYSTAVFGSCSISVASFVRMADLSRHLRDQRSFAWTSSSGGCDFEGSGSSLKSWTTRFWDGLPLGA